MTGYRAALPGSPGEAYLLERRIPLAIAQAAGVGYAAPGQWAHRNEAGAPVRDWHRGRLVFPHTDPAGNVVNLYGRAVGDAPKSVRHDHCAGAKGYFNAPAMREGSGPLTICEGAFDALALMAAGLPRVVAIFGVNAWRWDWARGADELLFALDTDPTGLEAFRELAPVARLRGKRVAYLEPEAYGGEKDAAAAWAAGTLRLGAMPEPAPDAPTRPERGDSPPDDPAPVDAPSSEPEASAAAPAWFVEAEPEPPSRAERVRAIRTRPGLHAPAALALGLSDEQAGYAGELAASWFGERVEWLAGLHAQVRAMPESEPQRAVWLAAIREAYDRRRARRNLRRCYACGRELGHTFDPPEARRAPCPTCHPEP